MGGNELDAEDIYQDSVLRLIEMTDQPDFELTSKLSTLLYRICDNKWKLVLEKRSVAKKYFIKRNAAEVEKDVEQHLDNEFYNGIFWECFNMLQVDCRRLLRACMKEIPIKEIAAVLDYTYGFARKKKCLCHNYLMNLISQHPQYRQLEKTEGNVKLY
jgi:DNA-directed RNA polymerase specialized sigma24 family protein